MGKDIKILEKIMVVTMTVMNMMMELQMKRFLMMKALNLKHTAKSVKLLKFMRDITTKKGNIGLYCSECNGILCKTTLENHLKMTMRKMVMECYK